MVSSGKERTLEEVKISYLSNKEFIWIWFKFCFYFPTTLVEKVLYCCFTHSSCFCLKKKKYLKYGSHKPESSPFENKRHMVSWNTKFDIFMHGYRSALLLYIPMYLFRVMKVLSNILKWCMVTQAPSSEVYFCSATDFHRHISTFSGQIWF